jgi:hypothetical protein
MIERFLAGLEAKLNDPVRCTYMTVVIPGNIDPLQRHYRFSVYVDAELRLANLGCSVGGGTLYRELETGDEDDLEIVCCVLDVDATDVAGARALLREHLPELGATVGTLVQYGDREDRFDGSAWHLDEPRSIED